MSLLIRDTTVVTVNPARDIFHHVSIVIEQGRISAIAPENQLPPKQYDEIVDARNFVLIPGFIQTHIHLCQTLFRGLADDLELLDWLCTKIFPFEAAHNDRSMYYSALVGIGELFSSGTTTILDMGSIRHETEIIRAIGETGLRAFVGKAMISIRNSGNQQPRQLLQRNSLLSNGIIHLTAELNMRLPLVSFFPVLIRFCRMLTPCLRNSPVCCSTHMHLKTGVKFRKCANVPVWKISSS
jgi:cytosine/adenosine deaminase-related metal-dependent hydrolase